MPRYKWMRCHAATTRSLSLHLALGHCNCWPFNKRSQKCFSFSLCLYLLQLWLAILLYCHRCLILLQASPVCHFLASRGRRRRLLSHPQKKKIARRFLCVPLSKIEFQIIFTALYLTCHAPRLVLSLSFCVSDYLFGSLACVVSV